MYFHSRCLVILFCILLSATGCGVSKQIAAADEPRQLLTKAVLEERSVAMEDVLIQEYREVVSEVAANADVNMAQLYRGDGVTFTSIPMTRLLELHSTDVLKGGLEVLFKPDDVIRVLPILSRKDDETEVVASLTCSWDEKNRRPAIHKWERGGSVMFATLIENALLKHSKEKGISSGEYKGVSFYGLNRHFLYFTRGGAQFMVPLEFDDTHNLFPGREIPLSQALQVLKTMASEEHKAPG